MILESNIIEFKGMPLFQKARFRPPMDMDGAIKDFACFFYMVQGSMQSFDSRGKIDLGEKEAVLKNCNNYVQRYVAAEGSEECEAIAIYLYPELLKTIYKNEVPSFIQKEGSQTNQPNKPTPPKKLIGNQLVEQYMSNLVLYFEQPEALDEELGILKLKELMLILLKSQNHENIRKLLSDIFRPVNAVFKETIEKNMFNQLSLDQLAFICHMSLSTFKREFKKVYNESPARHIKTRRLEEAALRLLCNNDSVSAIAFDVGFQDITTFSASFSEKYATSPKNFRLTQISK